jgi:hypothetical protein
MRLGAIPFRSILGVPFFARIIAGLSRAAVNLDPVVDAVLILPVRLPPTVLQNAGMYYDCDERAKEDKAGKGDRQIISGIHSKHGAVSNGVPSDV